MGAAPQRLPSHATNGRHVCSPGSATSPGAHGAVGNTATHPPRPSAVNPSPQLAGPTGTQAPSTNTSVALHVGFGAPPLPPVPTGGSASSPHPDATTHARRSAERISPGYNVQSMSSPS